jgi:hypothetical protein
MNIPLKEAWVSSFKTGVLSENELFFLCKHFCDQRSILFYYMSCSQDKCLLKDILAQLWKFRHPLAKWAKSEGEWSYSFLTIHCSSVRSVNCNSKQVVSVCFQSSCLLIHHLPMNSCLLQHLVHCFSWATLPHFEFFLRHFISLVILPICPKCHPLFVRALRILITVIWNSWCGN